MDKEPSKSSVQLDAVTVAIGLTSAVEDLTVELKGVKKDARKERRWRKLIVAALILVVLSLSANGYLSVRNHTLSQQVKSAQIASCQQSNRVRGDDIKLWDEAVELITTGKNTPTTSAGVMQKSEFLKFITHTFAPVNCNMLGGGSSSGN